MKPLLSIGALLDVSIEHYRKHLASILGIMLWIAVAQIPTFIGTLIDPQGSVPNGWQWTSFAFHVLGAITSFIAAVHVTVALTAAIRDQAGGKMVDPREALQAAWKKDLSFLFASLLHLIIVVLLPILPLVISFIVFAKSYFTDNEILINLSAIATFIFIIAALVVMTKLAISLGFVNQTNILEGKKGLEALKESNRLVTGRWWATFWRVLLPSILYTFIGFMLLGPISIGAELLARLLAQNSYLILKIIAVGSLLLSTAVNIFIVPMFLITAYYLYDSLRKTQ